MASRSHRFIRHPLIRRVADPTVLLLERAGLLRPFYRGCMAVIDRLSRSSWVQQHRFPQEVRTIRAFAQEIGLPAASHPAIIQASLRGYFWRQYMRTALFFGRIRLREAMVRIHGAEHVATAQARGRGILLISLHYIAGSIALLRYPLPGMPIQVEQFLAEQTRQADRAGLPDSNALGRGQDLVQALTILRRNGAVGVLIDGGRGQREVEISVLGRTVAIRPSFAHLAFLSGATVIPANIALDAHGDVHVHLHPALRDDATLPETQRVAALAQQAARFWEETWLNYPASVPHKAMQRYLRHFQRDGFQ